MVCIFSLETLHGRCWLGNRRDELEPELSGIFGESMETPLLLLLLVEFSPSIDIFHAVRQHVVYQTC